MSKIPPQLNELLIQLGQGFFFFAKHQHSPWEKFKLVIIPIVALRNKAELQAGNNQRQEKTSGKSEVYKERADIRQGLA